MKKSTVFWLSTSCTLFGIVIGFLLAPIKGGISCGNNCGNYGQYYHDPEESVESTAENIED